MKLSLRFFYALVLPVFLQGCMTATVSNQSIQKENITKLCAVLDPAVIQNVLDDSMRTDSQLQYELIPFNLEGSQGSSGLKIDEDGIAVVETYSSPRAEHVLWNRFDGSIEEYDRRVSQSDKKFHIWTNRRLSSNDSEEAIRFFEDCNGKEKPVASLSSKRIKEEIKKILEPVVLGTDVRVRLKNIGLDQYPMSVKEMVKGVVGCSVGFWYNGRYKSEDKSVAFIWLPFLDKIIFADGRLSYPFKKLNCVLVTHVKILDSKLQSYERQTYMYDFSQENTTVVPINIYQDAREQKNLSTFYMQSFNSKGQVIGDFPAGRASKGAEGFIWQNGEFHFLRDLIINLDDWKIHVVSDINEKGEIIGTAINSHGHIQAVLLIPLE